MGYENTGGRSSVPDFYTGDTFPGRSPFEPVRDEPEDRPPFPLPLHNNGNDDDEQPVPTEPNAPDPPEELPKREPDTETYKQGEPMPFHRPRE